MKQKYIVLGIILAAWILIPTCTPDDVITFFLIGLLGKYYVLVVIVLLLLLWKYNINLQKIKRTIRGLL